MADQYPTPLELAEAGYRGYATAFSGKTFDGRDMAEFTDLPERTRSAWAAAVDAIRARHENLAPPPAVKVETPHECGYYLNDPNGPDGTDQCRKPTTMLHLVRVWLNNMDGPAVDAGLPLCAKHGAMFTGGG
jgi:hypothetical protein